MDPALEPERLPFNENRFERNSWSFVATKGHILNSMCQSKNECVPASEQSEGKQCQFCNFSQTLKLPCFPDMVFSSNILKFSNAKAGVALEFSALEALKLVNHGVGGVEVACADEWKEHRSETGLTNKIHNPFDWTFSTEYKGTLKGDWKVEECKERIDVERLKRRDEIFFWDELTFFEDELHDHGIAKLSVKARVMTEFFYVLLRYFVRVDNVLIKIYDTRLYHDFATNYILREYTQREAKIPDLKMHTATLLDPDVVAPNLPITKQITEKLTFPS